LAVMAVAVFMTSCEQEELITENTPTDIIPPSELVKYNGKNLFVTPDGTIYVDEAGKLTASIMEDTTGDEQDKSQCCSIDTSGSGSTGSTFKLKFRKASNQNVYIYHYKKAGNIYLGTSIITQSSCPFLSTYTNPLSFIPTGTKVLSDAFIYDGSYCTRKRFTWTKNF